MKNTLNTSFENLDKTQLIKKINLLSNTELRKIFKNYNSQLVQTFLNRLSEDNKTQLTNENDIKYIENNIWLIEELDILQILILNSNQNYSLKDLINNDSIKCLKEIDYVEIFELLKDNPSKIKKFFNTNSNDFWVYDYYNEGFWKIVNLEDVDFYPQIFYKKFPIHIIR